MGTINSALSVTTDALNANQAALSVIANNVANADTTGYTLETPTWQENAPIEVDGISIGTGVTETGSTSQRDRVLEERLDQQQQLASASSTRLTALDSIQSLFSVDSDSSSSTSGDIGSDITDFFDSFSTLEADPTSSSDREAVLSAASTLAGSISGAASSLSEQQTALDQEASSVASQVNALTKSIAQLNEQIQATSPDGDAGTLEDQRQEDLSQLSALIGINQVTTENNGLTITTTSGQLLVSEDQSYELTTGTVGGLTAFYLGGADITASLATGGGELGGYLTARGYYSDPSDLSTLTGDIPSALNSLDELAYGIETSVNALNNAGTDLDGTEGTGTDASGVTGTGTTALYIFDEPTEVAGSAATMAVVMTDANQIAAAGFGDGTGDNSNAVAMAELSSSTVVDGQTPTDYYSSFVSTLGSTVSNVTTENTAQEASVTQLQTQRDALSAVNLNDEASSMALLETSYEAASRVFTILDTIMASALNLGVETSVSS